MRVAIEELVGLPRDTIWRRRAGLRSIVGNRRRRIGTLNWFAEVVPLERRVLATYEDCLEC